MGLTIHYSLKSSACSPKQVSTLVAMLRGLCPFVGVAGERTSLANTIIPLPLTQDTKPYEYNH